MTVATKVQPRYDDTENVADFYWHHYRGQHEHQTVVLSLDTHDGELLIEIDSRVGGGTPADVWNGRVLWFPLPYIPTPAAANALLDRVAPMAQAVLDADSNDTGPRQAIAEYLDAGAEFTDADIVAVWTIDSIGDEWLHDVTADMTDDDLHAYGQRILSELAESAGHPVAVCQGIDYWLQAHRDLLIATVVAPPVVTPQPAIDQRVQRWDIYDIADHLADLPAMIRRGGEHADRAARYAHRYADVLFRAAERGGQVAPCDSRYATITPTVWLLTAEADAGAGDYTGITRIYSSYDAAVIALHRWIIEQGIDLDAAMYGSVRTETSLCGDPDPDTTDGIIVHYGINQTEVH